jgi:hypothetical protein
MERGVPIFPASRELTIVHRILRLAVVAEFVGHGAFGIITKAAWLPYFGVVGIPEWAAWRLMPVVGAVDVALGIVAVFRPMPAALLYMAAWGLWTALLRPLTGEGWWEFLERAARLAWMPRLATAALSDEEAIVEQEPSGKIPDSGVG